MTETPHRFATALVLHSEDDDSVLFGHEARTELRQAKFRGDLSLPMTFCGEKEDYINAITRVIQQEVFVEQAIYQNLNVDIRESIQPFLKFTILDVEVRVFDLFVPRELLYQVNSYKLTDYTLLNYNELQNHPQVRHGIAEIVGAWRYGSAENLQSNLNTLLVSG